MKRSRLKTTLIGAMVGVLLLTAIVLAAGESLPRHVIGSGGSSIENGITLRNAIGQPIAGAVSNGITLCSGFVCGQSTSAPFDNNHFVYLPLVLK